ncbi:MULTISPECIES: hypothetical protein [Mesobacillus]|uniref:YfhE family protein n=1 Tax=Mesobacillus stamsii TaxID=225347 RepID=A0ABU0FUD5_9BACI|nr:MULTISPECIES: hypothetical protein [Mesobacillus]MDQ0413533.1 hypothetical protein [Mesobacillus stamsii]
MKKQDGRHQKPVNVEFGMEFGDINAGKFYEQPFANKKGKQKTEKDCK